MPWEDNIEAHNVLRKENYSDLAKDLEDSGFLVKLIPDGVPRLVGKSACMFLTQN